VLRVGRPAVIDAELAASSAVAAVVPVPAVLDRVNAGDASAVLLEIPPGQPMAHFARHRPELARAAGQACGTVHALLAGVPAPAGLRAVPGPDRGTPAGRPRVLHLDLHPLNILADASGDVTGVLDWANAAAGDPDLDRARTWTILTLDPAARARRGEPGWARAVPGMDPVRQAARYPRRPPRMGMRIHALRSRRTLHSSRDAAHYRCAG
jgi:Ser/Thr protein kinase RdoA (MazF antagonist)